MKFPLIAVAGVLATGCATTNQLQTHQSRAIVIPAEPIVLAFEETKPNQQPNLNLEAETALLTEVQSLIDDAQGLGQLADGQRSAWVNALLSYKEGQRNYAMKVANDIKASLGQQLNTYYLKQARLELQMVKTLMNKGRNEYRKQDQLAKLITQGEGKQAYDLGTELNSELIVAKVFYQVEADDSFEKISQRAELYGNPNWWPLIYAENGAKVEDPDALSKGLTLAISVHPSRDELQRALDYAKTRKSLRGELRYQLDQEFLYGRHKTASIIAAPLFN